MSRCFPFPPPGYDKKPRPEEDLLQEEKRREKKHKKEKKSKRKRGEGDEKEERNKDRGKEKEKKEKKEKHRDKKDKEKNKSKDKDKSSSSISVDATTAGQPETGVRDNALTREECSNSKSHGFSENKFASAFQCQNGSSLDDNRLLRESAESKFVQELGRRIKDEGKAIGSQTAQRSSTLDRRGCEEMHTVMGLQNSAKYMACESDQGVDPNKLEGKGHKKLEGKGLKNGLQLNGSNMVQNLTGSIDGKVKTPPEAVPRVIERMVQEKDHELVQRVVERTIQETDKYKEKSDDKRGEKRKDRDKKEKKSHGKDKGRDKDKKKVEKERTENKKRDQDRSKELYTNDHSRSSKSINVYSSQADNKIVSTEENVKKRKDVVANGFDHETEIRSNKLRTHQLMNNGKILEACQSPGLLDSKRLCIPLQDKVGTKRHELNGTVGSQLPYMSKQKPPSVPSTRSDQPIEALEKSLLCNVVVEAPKKLPQAPVVVEAKLPQAPVLVEAKLPQAPVLVEAKLPQAPVLMEASTEGPLASKVIEISRRAPQASRIVEPLKKHSGADRITEPSITVEAKHPQATVVVEASTEDPLAGKVIEIPKRAPHASRNVESLKKHSGADRITEPSRKQPPHPDLKYLNEVLSVPKMEEWSGVDEQEWLFSNKDLPLEKQKPDVSVDTRQLHVWSEALHIESADIYALPYVIPY